MRNQLHAVHRELKESKNRTTNKHYDLILNHLYIMKFRQ
jgi:hypothetical protein